MFSSQDWQIKLVYAGFGFLFAVIGMLLSPVTAQRDKFGEIECTGLKVVDADGETVVMLSGYENGGVVTVYGKVKLDDSEELSDDIKALQRAVSVLNAPRPQVTIGIIKTGGYVDVCGNDGESKATLGCGEYGGRAAVQGNEGKSRASLSISEYGGLVSATGKDGKDEKPSAGLGIDEDGGIVFTMDRYGQIKRLE